MTPTIAAADVLPIAHRAPLRPRRNRLTVCRGCGARRALFRRWHDRHTVRHHRDYDLCFACFRSARDRQRARQLRLKGFR